MLINLDHLLLDEISEITDLTIDKSIIKQFSEPQEKESIKLKFNKATIYINHNDYLMKGKESIIDKNNSEYFDIERYLLETSKHLRSLEKKKKKEREAVNEKINDILRQEYQMYKYNKKINNLMIKDIMKKDDFKMPATVSLHPCLFLNEELKSQCNLIKLDSFTSYLYSNLVNILRTQKIRDINNPLLRRCILSDNVLLFKYLTLTIICQIEQGLGQDHISILAAGKIQNLNLLLKNVKY